MTLDQDIETVREAAHAEQPLQGQVDAADAALDRLRTALREAEAKIWPGTTERLYMLAPTSEAKAAYLRQQSGPTGGLVRHSRTQGDPPMKCAVCGKWLDPYGPGWVHKNRGIFGADGHAAEPKESE